MFWLRLVLVASCFVCLYRSYCCVLVFIVLPAANSWQSRGGRRKRSELNSPVWIAGWPCVTETSGCHFLIYLLEHLLFELMPPKGLGMFRAIMRCNMLRLRTSMVEPLQRASCLNLWQQACLGQHRGNIHIR